MPSGFVATLSDRFGNHIEMDKEKTIMTQETTGREACAQRHSDAEQRVSDAVREPQGAGKELTRQAGGQAVPTLRLPESWEQCVQEMSMADVYRETLCRLPDDARVTITYRHPACGAGLGCDSAVTAEKRCLQWTDSVLMIARMKDGMDSNGKMPEAWATLIPMSNVMAVDVDWEVGSGEPRRQDPTSYFIDDADASFEELDLDEEALENLFSDADPLVPETIRDVLPEKIGTVRISGQACDVLRLPNGDFVIEHPGVPCGQIPITLSDIVRLAEHGQIRLDNGMTASWVSPSDEPDDDDEPADDSTADASLRCDFLGTTVDKAGEEVDLLVAPGTRRHDGFRMRRHDGKDARVILPSLTELKALYRDDDIRFADGGEERFRDIMTRLNMDLDGDDGDDKDFLMRGANASATASDGLGSLTVAELRAMARELGRPAYHANGRMKSKAELIEAIRIKEDARGDEASPDDPADETCEFPARGAISSYDKKGQFVNCFQLRNMGQAKSADAFKMPPVRKGYRSQLESAFTRGRKVSMTGTLSSVMRYDNCLRLVLADITITKGAGGYLSHMSLFVSRDYKVPEIGSKLSVEGFVYAYVPNQTGDGRRQLAVNATTVRTVRK